MHGYGAAIYYYGCCICVLKSIVYVFIHMLILCSIIDCYKNRLRLVLYAWLWYSYIGCEFVTIAMMCSAMCTHHYLPTIIVI